MHKYRFEKVF